VLSPVRKGAAVRMRRFYLLPLFAALACGAALFLTWRSGAEFSSAPRVPASGNAVPRVVSLAPSLTETLRLLGLQGAVVGVTTFCPFSDMKNVARVGGYATPDLEKIAAVRPDVVLMLEEHRKAGIEDKCRRLGIDVLVVSTATVEDVLRSIVQVGERCGRGKEGRRAAAELRRRMESLAGGEAESPRPAVLVTVGKKMGSGGPAAVFAAGPGTFYDDLLKRAGARNACRAARGTYAYLSPEAIVRSRADIIIDVVPGASKREAEAIVAGWKKIPGMKARVSVLTGEYVARPGPSFVRTLADIVKVVAAWRSTR